MWLDICNRFSQMDVPTCARVNVDSKAGLTLGLGFFAVLTIQKDRICHQISIDHPAVILSNPHLRSGDREEDPIGLIELVLLSVSVIPSV